MYKTPDDLLRMVDTERENVPSLGLGFKKTTLDPELHQRLVAHLTRSIQLFKSEPANAFVKTDNSNAYPSLLYHDDAFNEQLMKDLKPAHEEWSGVKLKNEACFGIRVYQPGSYLLNHSDHARTHVVSSTICVDSSLNNPWPLYVEDHDGKAHQVDMGPGDMVFFEGARLIHGRPYPMDGDYFASIFVHFSPLDWDVDGDAK